jgi:hypothetical protein
MVLCSITPRLIIPFALGAIIVGAVARFSALARIAAFVLFGFFLFPVVFRPAVPDPAIFAWIDMHYAAVLSHGERLAAGLKPYTETQPSYGLLPALLMSLAPHGISFGWLVLIVQWSQIIFGLLMLVSLRLAIGSRQQALFWVATTLTLLALAPFLSTNGLPIWFPNQTGIRFIFLPIAMITVLVTISDDSWRKALSFGAVGGLGIVHNLETGLIISAALGITLLFGLAKASIPIMVLASLGALCAGMSVFFATAAFMIMQTNAGYDELASPLLGFFSLFVSGFGGLHLRLTPPFLVILLHASYLVFRGADSAVRQKAPLDAGLLFPATFILLWFPYYVNRPDAWNLWSFVAIYCVILARLAALLPAWRLSTGVAAAILVAFSFTNFRTLLPWSLVHRSPPHGSTACLDGLHAPAALCSALRQKAEYIKHVSALNVVWLTHYPLQTMRMSGDVGRLPKIDFISLAISQRNFESLVETLKKKRPDMIIVDAPDPRLQIPAGMLRITEEVLAALAGEYCRGEQEKGWIVYRPCNINPLSNH